MVLGARRVERLEQTAELVTKAAVVSRVPRPTSSTRNSVSAWSTPRWKRSVASTSSTTPVSDQPSWRPARRRSSSSIVDVNLHGSYWMA